MAADSVMRSISYHIYYTNYHGSNTRDIHFSFFTENYPLPRYLQKITRFRNILNKIKKNPTHAAC